MGVISNGAEWYYDCKPLVVIKETAASVYVERSADNGWRTVIPKSDDRLCHARKLKGHVARQISRYEHLVKYNTKRARSAACAAEVQQRCVDELKVLQIQLRQMTSHCCLGKDVK